LKEYEKKTIVGFEQNIFSIAVKNVTNVITVNGNIVTNFNFMLPILNSTVVANKSAITASI
jgi:hypothetical protein